MLQPRKRHLTRVQGFVKTKEENEWLRGRLEAAITARFLQDTVAEASVDTVKQADAECDAAHLAIKAQVDE